MSDREAFIEGELSRLRRLIGQEITISAAPYLTQVNTDAVRHWTRATGDRNPRYEEKAADTCVAPPALLYAFSPLSVGYRGGLGGFHSLFGGSHWKWQHPLVPGTSVSARTYFAGIDELPSRFAGRMFKQTATTKFSDGDGTSLAEVSSWGMRTDRRASASRAVHESVELASYSAADLADITSQYRQEVETVRSGDASRAGLRPGARLPSMIRGPYSTATAVSFAQAWGGVFISSHGYWFETLAKHPKLGVPGASGAPESPESVHWNSAMARAVGLPDSYDYGPERVAWASILLTNWLADWGQLDELYCEVRGFNYVGDLIRFEGSVTEVAAGSARIEFAGTNQRDEVTISGWGQVSFGE
jgi:hypothetical protein